MKIELLTVKLFNGLPATAYPEYGRGVANFTALIDDQIYVYQAVLRVRPDGSYHVVLKDGPAVVGRHCLTLRDGPMRTALTVAAVRAYNALTVAVAA